MSRKNEPTGKTHRIEHVRDFLNVPTNRREACLKDFRRWMQITDAGNALLAGIGGIQPGAFVWTDDGVVGADHVRLVTPDGEVFATISRDGAVSTPTPANTRNPHSA